MTSLSASTADGEFDPATSRLGIYVHFPWCARHCPYCDFNVTTRGPIPHTEYRDAVIADLRREAGRFVGRPPAVSVYFGGGTPSLWAPDCVAAIIEAVAQIYGLRADAEITLECNPEALDGPALQTWRAVGINRLSIGAQSFDNDALVKLGRAHRAVDIERVVGAARLAGFDEYSLDLIHGWSGQSLEQAVADVHAALRLEPVHISTYQLTIEAQTPYGARSKRGEQLLAPEEPLLAMFEGVRSALAEGGVPPYEISSAARQGYEAVHNTLYWTMGEYAAVGAGAHGFSRHHAEAERWQTERHAWRYMRRALQGDSTHVTTDAIDALGLRTDQLLTGLRMDRGVLVDPALRSIFGQEATKLVVDGLLEDVGGRWRVTGRGRQLLDLVICRITR